MASPIVVMGATMSCTMGDSSGTLTVTSQMIMQINGELVATVQDSAGFTNIPMFGCCTIMSLLALHPQPCLPDTGGQWAPSLPAPSQINGLEVLTSPCTLACSIGGTISVDDAGQIIAEAL